MYASFLMPLSSFVALALISGMVSNLLPFKGLLSMGNHMEQGQVSKGGGEKQ